MWWVGSVGAQRNEPQEVDPVALTEDNWNALRVTGSLSETLVVALVALVGLVMMESTGVTERVCGLMPPCPP